MKPADLDRIETVLQIKLPADYRRIMEAYPFAADSMGTDMLVNDAEVLLKWNAGERDEATGDTDDSSANKDRFQIGSDGGELRFFIQLVGPANPIVCYDLESGKLFTYANDMAEYRERCVRVDAGNESLPNEDNDIPERMKWFFSLGLLALLGLFGYGVFKLIFWALSLSRLSGWKTNDLSIRGAFCEADGRYFSGASSPAGKPKCPIS